MWAVLGRAHISTNIYKKQTVVLGFYKNQGRMSTHPDPYNLVLTSFPPSISAVCRGATLWGLEQNHATSFLSRMARSSYGIAYQIKWDPTNPNHQPSDKHWDASTSRWVAYGQMTWLLKRVRDQTNLIFFTRANSQLLFSSGGRSCRRACTRRIRALLPKCKPQRPR